MNHNRQIQDEIARKGGEPLIVDGKTTAAAAVHKVTQPTGQVD